MSEKTALITGITGQDGSLLAQYLLSQKYQIIAPTRKKACLDNLQILGIKQDPNIKFITYKKKSDFKQIIKKHQIDEIYHLAAMTHVGDSFSDSGVIFKVNTKWTVLLLSYIEKHSPQSKFFFASSSEIFDKSSNNHANENSEKMPQSPYGISKLAAHQMVEYYRNVKGLYACNGILFNHESELRPENFVSMKIFKNVARIVKHGGAALELGNIEAKKDWGYAPGYVQGFQKALQVSVAGDYVFSTGELHTVKQMVSAAFEALGYPIYWSGEGINAKARNNENKIVVQINPKYFRPLDDNSLAGDSSKAKVDLAWAQATPFKQWVGKLTIKEFRKISL